MAAAGERSLVARMTTRRRRRPHGKFQGVVEDGFGDFGFVGFEADDASHDVVEADALGDGDGGGVTLGFRVV